MKIFTSKYSDNHWEYYGKLDPYFGVLSDEKYKSKNMDPEAKANFFASGEKHIDEVWKTVRDCLSSDFSPEKALDFGCGVGRIAIPLSPIIKEVFGVDVSGSMIKEARKNCSEKGISNVRFVNNINELPADTKFDFIHSFIVFQHIPTTKGEKIFKDLIGCLSEGGVGALHFTYHASAYARFVHWVLRNIPFACNVYNLLIGRGLTYPIMQTNFYNLNRLLFILQSEKYRNIYLKFTLHKRNSGVMIYFQKEGNQNGDGY